MNTLIANKNYINALTGLRAVAAYMVYLRHYPSFMQQTAETGIYNFFLEMQLGVTVFFVLSGFLITYRYFDAGQFSFKKYMANRFARIYPMYFLLTTLTFIVLYYLQTYSRQELPVIYLLNISFLKGFSDIYLLTGIGQGWTLTVEESFYLLAPLIFLVIKKNIFLLVPLVMLFIATGLGLVALFSKTDFYGFFPSVDFMLDVTFFGRCVEFFIGIALAIYIKKNKALKEKGFYTYIGAGGILLCLLALSLLAQYHPIILSAHPGKMILRSLLPSIAIAVLMYGLISEKTIVSTLLGSRLLMLLGKSSYCFYLIHVGIFSTFLDNYTSSYLLQFCMLNVIAILLFKCVEEPINNFLRKKFRTA